MEVERWWWGTHRGCDQRSLANQVGVRNGHAEAQRRARLLHGRYRRLEVAGEGRGGGGRGGGRVGGLRGKQRRRKKVEKIEIEWQRWGLRTAKRGDTGCYRRGKKEKKEGTVDYTSKQD